MSSENDLNKEFYFLDSEHYELLQKTDKINDVWKTVNLNKISLIILPSEQDAFMDNYTEHALTTDNTFKPFKKRGL